MPQRKAQPGHVLVEYVGLKPAETDHLYGTGIEWTGKGDVQEVPAANWSKMRKHVDVWREYKPEAEAPAPSSPAAFDLATATDEQVHAEAKARGYDIHPNTKGENLRSKFAALASLADRPE
jgi:hypothetical protein